MRMLILLVAGLCAFPQLTARDDRRSVSIDLFETGPGTENETAFRPLEDSVRELRAAGSAGSGLSVSGQSAPTGLPFALLSLANSSAEYVLFVESRESIKKDFLASIRIRHPLLELDAGTRWLPGPRTIFLAAPDARSLFARRAIDSSRDEPATPAIPDGRRFPLLFARIPLSAWAPGVFGVRGDPERDNGFYFASERLLFAIGRQRGVLAMHGPLALPGGERFAYAWLDLERGRERRTQCAAHDSLAEFEEAAEFCPAGARKYTSHAGYGRLLADRHPDFLLAGLEVERRTAWDYADYDAHRLASNRAGRSGLVAASLRALQLLEVEGAGQDRGNDGFRLGGIALSPELHESLPGLREAGSGRLLVRARAYQRRRYGPQAQSPARDSPALRREFTAGGLGYRLQTPGSDFEIYGEARRHGGRSVELRLELGPRPGPPEAPGLALLEPGREAPPDREEIPWGWRFSVSLIFGKLAGGAGEFLFVRAPPERGAGVRFFGEENGALIVRLQSRYFALYLESRLAAATGRISTFANFQFRVTF